MFCFIFKRIVNRFKFDCSFSYTIFSMVKTQCLRILKLLLNLQFFSWKSLMHVNVCHSKAKSGVSRDHTMKTSFIRYYKICLFLFFFKYHEIRKREVKFI